MTTVVNIKDAPPGWTSDPRFVYIGRDRFDMRYEEAERGFDGRFSNPIVLRFEANRDKVLGLYRNWFARQVERNAWFRRQLLGLYGKTLVCFCKPLACHGDVIVEWLEAQP